MAEQRATPTVVTTDWLKARGGLHDACINTIQRIESRLVIQIDDEWANEHDGPDDNSPGQLALHGAVLLAGSEEDLPGSYISDFSLETDGNVRLDCSKGRFRIAVDGIFFTHCKNDR